MPTVQLTGIYDDGTQRGNDIPANPRRTLRFQRGTALVIEVELYRISGVPLPSASVAPAVFTLKKRPQIEPPLISRVGLPVLGRAPNVIGFAFTPEDTALLDFGLYSYDIRGLVVGEGWQTLIGLSPVALEPNDGQPGDPVTAVSPVVFYYQLPAIIQSFVLAPPTVFEIGDTLTNPSFSLTYARTPDAVTLTDGTNVLSLSPPFTSAVLPYSYMETAINAEQVFTATAVEAGSPNTMATCAAQWWPRVFWGAALPPGLGNYTEAFIEGLSDSILLPSRVYSPGYAAPGSTHLYYCVPTVYGGDEGDFFDAHTGFGAAMHKAASGVPDTNAFGVTVGYDVWESDNHGLGAVTLRVV